jgi:hypothetical protein
VPARVNGSSVVALGRKLDLAARIATRHANTLAAELGASAAREMVFTRLEVQALDRVLSAVTTEIVEVARQLELPMVLLKHAALRHAGYVAEGERHARDVDVLLPSQRAPDLQRALLARGFQHGSIAPPFHLPPLTRRPGEVVEVHQSVWGLRLNKNHRSNQPVNAADLIAAGLTSEIAPGLHIPIRNVLAAHAVVHGLVQHRTSPEGYPSMRALADLVALGALRGDQETNFLQHVSPGADSALAMTALRLSQAMTEGVDMATLDPASAEVELLSHVVASGCDDAYRRALRFERLSELGSLHALGKVARGALLSPRPARVAGSPLARLSFRATRPVSLALEFAKAGASYAALRLSLRWR